MSAPGAAAKIGPNAVTRLAEALDADPGRVVRDAVFAAAGQGRHLERPPTRMVDGDDVARLQRALFDRLGEAAASAVARRAGRLTAAYLVECRIPRPLRLLLGVAPVALAAPVLAAAIGRNAWTFVGDGRFDWQRESRGLRLTISGAPVPRLLRTAQPGCAYYAGTFEALFAAVLRCEAEVTETRCQAQGADRCCFTVGLRRHRRGVPDRARDPRTAG